MTEIHVSSCLFQDHPTANFIATPSTVSLTFFAIFLSISQEGTVRVPPALQPYLGLEVIEKPKYSPLKYIGPNQHSRPARPAPKTR